MYFLVFFDNVYARVCVVCIRYLTTLFLHKEDPEDGPKMREERREEGR